MSKDDFCSFCGIEHLNKETWPRTCGVCKNITYKNPIPIVVMMIPVNTIPASQHGWLVEQRNINPNKGGWAFPSGFIEHGETWQQAAVRELKEELGLSIKDKDLYLVEIVNATNGNMLIFCAHHYGVYRDDIKFEPNEEVSAICFPILPSHQELCFPLHNEVWKRFYNTLD